MKATAQEYDFHQRILARDDPVAFAAEMPHVEMVRWRTLVCPNGRRVETLDGVRLWNSDDVHLTEAGSVLVWKWWLPQLRAAR